VRIYSKLIGAAVLAAVLGMSAGCSDDPANQAERSAQQKTAEAMDLYLYKGDGEAARARLDAAMAQRGSRLSRDAAALAMGNLDLGQIRRQSSELELTKVPAQQELAGIQEQIRRIQKLQIQQRRIQQLIETGDQEIIELRQALEGGGPFEKGLREELAQAQEQLSRLEGERQEWAAREAAADSQLAALQARADEQFRQAKASSGSQQISLEQAGYQILLEKKPFYFDKQEAVNQLELLDSRIAQVRPRKELLERGIAQTEQKIAGLENSAELAQLRTQQNELAAQLGREEGLLREQLNRFKQNVAAYRQAVERLTESLKILLERYEGIQSRDAQPTVLYKKGQVQSLSGSVMASRLVFEANVSLAVESMIQAAGSDEALKAVLQEGFLTVAEDQLLTAATESFDQADQTYEQALSAGRGLGGEAGKQFVLNVTQSRLLNLRAKMKLADSLDRYELAEKIQAALEEQIQKAAELGPGFTQSETARLLEKGLHYIPQMPYDSELYFEEIRAEISSWKQVQGTPQQREEAARRALALIGQYEAQADEKLLQMLQPEKQALQAAIERGFTEAAPVPSARAGGEPNQP
jgi:hypothetical protein